MTTTPASSSGFVPLQGAPCCNQSTTVVLSDGESGPPRGIAPDDTADSTVGALDCTVQQEDHVVLWHPEQLLSKTASTLVRPVHPSSGGGGCVEPPEEVPGAPEQPRRQATMSAAGATRKRAASFMAVKP
jgi:hypothetical protein